MLKAWRGNPPGFFNVVGFLKSMVLSLNIFDSLLIIKNDE